LDVNVSPAPLTVTVDDATWEIATPFPQFTPDYSGFVLGENESILGGTLAFNTAANVNSTVGTYPVTSSGLTSTNYAITYVPGTLTVTPAIVAIDIRSASLNIDMNGAISVVVFGSSTFNVAGVSVDSFQLAGVQVDAFNYSFIDADLDGVADLKFDVRNSDPLKASLRELYADLLLEDLADDAYYSSRQDALIALDGVFGQYDQEFHGADSTTLFLAGRSLRTLLQSLCV
jgi:hypothetical protein